MTLSPARALRALTRPVRQWLPKRRDDSGLTTLEWLLIVAAVAGLAALAVVLVQRVVSDTSEQIAGNSARLTAAKVAAQQAADVAKAKALPTGTGAALLAAEARDWRIAKSACELIAITYSDAAGEGKRLTATFGSNTGTNGMFEAQPMAPATGEWTTWHPELHCQIGDEDA